MKEIIYDELKSQEKINKDLQVDYGYITKAFEKWRFYPDIIIKNKEKELAITILTDVTSNKDEKLVKQIKNRNRYFKEKNLEPIWFVEDAEQSIDMNHRVIHLWEAELDISIKTAEDLRWEETLNSLSLKYPLFELFNYHHKKVPSTYDIQSIYYVHSTEINIVFTVQRFIKDETKYPFRAFALNKAYQISLSTALWTSRELQLSEPEIEEKQREKFIELIKQQEAAYDIKEQEKPQLLQLSANSYKNIGLLNSNDNNPLKAKLKNSSKNFLNRQVQVHELKESDLSKVMLAYIKNFNRVSAAELSEYLVLKCGASAETFSTGRYKNYSVVCKFLDSLVNKGVLEFVKKDFVNDRIYKVIPIALASYKYE